MAWRRESRLLVAVSKWYLLLLWLKWAWSTYRIQHEEVEAGTGAEGHQGGTAIQSVACTHHGVSWLEGIFLCRLTFRHLKQRMSHQKRIKGKFQNRRLNANNREEKERKEKRKEKRKRMWKLKLEARDESDDHSVLNASTFSIVCDMLIISWEKGSLRMTNID